MDFSIYALTLRYLAHKLGSSDADIITCLMIIILFIIKENGRTR